MSVFNAYITLAGAVDADITCDELMARRMSFRIGGVAKLFCVCHTLRALQRVLTVLAAEGVRWVVLGRRTHVLVSDDGFDGCIIVLGREFSRISLVDAPSGDQTIVTAGAGVVLTKLLSSALSANLTGLEFLCGIPGTVGGAVAMNAGSTDQWLSSCIKEVVVFRPDEGLHKYLVQDIIWDHRFTSIPSHEIILEVTLVLAQGIGDKIAASMDQCLIRRRRTQVFDKPSCGPVFRDAAHTNAEVLIEKCGLKGYAVGGVAVSEKHANFIVNVGSGSAADVMAVVRSVYDTVKDAYDVELIPEIKFLGFK